MTINVFDRLRSMGGVRLYPGADLSLADDGAFLPADHHAALRVSNGAEAYGGYVRLFGLNAADGVDAVLWNEAEYWKFAWAGRCSAYWCFAGTAWGDQYAYDLSRLRNGDEGVYLLDCLSMTPVQVASTFSEFLRDEFLRTAAEPYDEMTVHARRALGDLGAGKLLTYQPSILLGGTEDIANIRTMDARAAMICNGDVAIQLDAALPESVLRGVTTYEDDLRRERLRLIWDKD